LIRRRTLYEEVTRLRGRRGKRRTLTWRIAEVRAVNSIMAQEVEKVGITGLQKLLTCSVVCTSDVAGKKTASHTIELGIEPELLVDSESDMLQMCVELVD
jgi:hypothetical protein